MSTNNYQTTFILTSVLSKEDTNQVVKSFSDFLVKEDAKIIHQTAPKLQDLAYRIKKMYTGVYVHIEFKSSGDVISKLETMYKRNEQVLRFLTTKLDKHGIAYKEKQRANESAVEKSQKEAITTQNKNIPESSKKKDRKKKYCRFRRFLIKYIDYLNKNFLKNFLNEQGKILPRRYTGTSAKYQRKLACAIKIARRLAIIEYVTDNLKNQKLR